MSQFAIFYTIGQHQSTIIQIMLTFSLQTALVRTGPVFGPEGSALHAKRSKSWPKTGPRTDFVTSDACGWMHGQTNMFFQTPLHNSPFGAKNTIFVEKKLKNTKCI